MKTQPTFRCAWTGARSRPPVCNGHEPRRLRASCHDGRSIEELPEVRERRAEIDRRQHGYHLSPERIPRARPAPPAARRRNSEIPTHHITCRIFLDGATVWPMALSHTAVRATPLLHMENRVRRPYSKRFDRSALIRAYSLSTLEQGLEQRIDLK